MKIKKVGNKPEEEKSPIPENESIDINLDDLDKKFDKEFIQSKSFFNSKLFLFGSLGIGLVVIIILLFIFVINKDNNETTSILKQTASDSLKLKELELKEKELKLKEQQLSGSQQNNNTESTKPVEVIQTAAPDKVREWINALGSRDFSKAYYMMSKTKRGDYSKFSSTKGYGGITSTSINNCYTDSYGSCYAEVIADYEAIDPANRSGKYRQKFFINNCSGFWEITEIKTLNIQYY
jgi:hypothetical protein